MHIAHRWRERDAPRQQTSKVCNLYKGTACELWPEGLQVSNTAASSKVNRLPTQFLFYTADKTPDLCQHYGPSVFDAIRKQRSK